MLLCYKMNKPSLTNSLGSPTNKFLQSVSTSKKSSESPLGKSKLSPKIGMFSNVLSFVIIWMLYDYIKNIEKSGCAAKCGVSEKEITIYKYILYFNFCSILLTFVINTYNAFKPSDASGGGAKMLMFFSIVLFMLVSLASLYLSYIQLSIFRKLNNKVCECANKDVKTKVIYGYHILQFILLMVILVFGIFGLL